MNEQDTPELLPCPFCGPQADEELAANLREVRCLKHDYAVGYTIFCACCGVEIHDEYKDDLVTIWNTRPAMLDTTAQADTIKALTEALESISGMGQYQAYREDSARKVAAAALSAAKETT